MKISWRHAFYVGGFLAILSGVMGLVIAGGDLLTRDTIAKNKIEKEQNGLKKVFGENVTFGEATSVPENEILQKYWTVAVNDAEIGRVYSTSAKNAYGTVSLLVGVNKDYSLGNIVVLENSESYAATLEENYLDVYAKSEDKETAVLAVKCGATEGAKICRNMILAARDHYKGGEGA